MIRSANRIEISVVRTTEPYVNKNKEPFSLDYNLKLSDAEDAKEL